MHNKKGKTTVEIGPKVDKDLRSFEKFLIEQISQSTDPVDTEIVMNGYANHILKSKKTEKVSGSKQYVFWWLLRDSLRNRKIIQTKLSKRYALMIFMFGVLGSLGVLVVSIVFLRLIQMINAGEVDLGRISSSFGSALLLWVIIIIPMILVSFGLLKYRGRMLGRHWIVTDQYKRYVGQMDAFREFVRLTHKDKLRFESKELHKESVALTRPYAIACGYIKK